jgi:outer membrane protein OmpA-like peptidoglycan-associated protein
MMLAMGAVTLLSGCATKKYVRTSVDTSAQQLSSRIDTHDQQIKQNGGQIDELNGLTRENSQKIATLDNGVKQADSKAQQAMGVGQNAQTSANKAQSEVASLGSKFDNRNHYVVLNQNQVKFKFDSAKLSDDAKKSLDDVAKQLKDNPDTILVMEGHTDSVGSDDYNIRLGQRRIEAVTRYLVVDQEVPMNRISDLSFGKERPLNTEKGKAARADNRAVVIRVMGPQLTGQEGMVSQSQTSGAETQPSR